MSVSPAAAPKPASLEDNAAHLLVVDDDRRIRALLQRFLSENGYRVTTAGNAAEARLALNALVFDLLVLDVMMPELSGPDLVKRLRQDEGAGPHLPVIFVSARDTTSAKVEALRLGADDYVTKPFSVEELVERVKAVLRRAGTHAPATHRLSYHDLVIDPDTRDVLRAGRLVELTPTEYKLLHYLVSNSRRVLTREQILEAVWDYTFVGNASVLETYISYLRQKVDVVEPSLIHTVRGVGYSLRLPTGWAADAAG